MLYVPSPAEYLWYLTSEPGQPVGGAFGTSVTPGQNIYGSYVQLLSGASVTQDIWRIKINVNSGAVSAQIRDTLLTLGIDPAGGTTYTDLFTHLLVSAAAGYQQPSGGVWYEFPFFIPAGSSIAVKGSVNNATVGTFRCWVQLWGKPRRPEDTWRGKIFRSFGEVTASSRGTILTPGDTSEGAWQQLGSALDVPLQWWQFGYGCADTTMTTIVMHGDLALGTASAKQVIIEDARFSQDSGEFIAKPEIGAFARGAVGDFVYGRIQGHNPPSTDSSMMAYGVGG